MPVVPMFQLDGLNLQTSLVNHQIGDTLVAINVDFNPIGAMSKRSGINAFLGTPDTNQVTSLFSLRTSQGTAPTLYRSSGTNIYYSAQGTGAWTAATNGSIATGGTVRSGILNDVMIVGDGVGSTRHTTDGTSFTNTTLAPLAKDFIDYQQRMYAVGTASDLFYSTTGDATNWNTSGTSDSSSLNIPGAGKLIKAIKLADRLLTHKSSGLMHRWDGYSLVDMATNLAMTSPMVSDKSEDYGFWVNRLGVYGCDGGRPQLISRLVQPLFYNNTGSAVAGTQFDVMAGGVHRYNYYMSLGTITDDSVGKTIDNAVLYYDYLQNNFGVYQYPFLPTSYHSYKDYQGNQQLIMGNNAGQVYQTSGTATTDNGTAIYSEVVGVIHGGTLLDKKWNRMRMMFDPGSQARFSIALTDSLRIPTDQRAWTPILSINGFDSSSGVMDYRFPVGSRGKFLFWKVSDDSKTSQWTCFGGEIDVEGIQTGS